MNKKDIKLISSVLKRKGQPDLADLLAGAYGEIDESSTYGNYLNSTISQYLFYLPLENFHKLKNISRKDKKNLLDSVLYLYPHQDESPEIVNIELRVLREDEEETIQLENKDLISCEFTKEQLDKCDSKISSGDYDGAISSAGSLLEGVFDEIHKECTGDSIKPIDDLRGGYKKLKVLLKLSDEQYSNESIKAVVRGLTSIIGGLDAIRNQMGDRHKITAKPWKRHAKLCVNSARIITDFLYETLIAQKEKIQKLYDDLVKILDSSKRLLEKDELLSEEVVLKHLEKYDIFLKNIIKNKFIKEFKIERFRESDIFFSAMNIFFEEIGKDDIDEIFKEHKNNNQACGLYKFLKLIEKEKETSFLSSEANKYIIKKDKMREEHEKPVKITDVPF
ncbi:hypothetical protein BMS3Abin15_01132 [bacterium BMS3Abin15]|nr:hypothetical protein BMS3Abin15_01132 [bacterium BMS3Abin15]HDZ85821.1 hypothetical protein [Candidatus Moranbacteria bacterium]